MPCIPHRPLARGLIAAALTAFTAATLAGTAAAQERGDDRPIFRRFVGGHDPGYNRQIVFEYPASLRPQTYPDAEIVENTGLNIVRSTQPQNRVYASTSFGYAKSEWKAPEQGLEKARVIQFDMTQILNFRIGNALVFNFGLGLGFMDGLSVDAEDGLRTRLELFLPLQMGFAIPLGETFVVDAKVVQSSFFGSGPVLSAARGYLGIGFNY